MKKIVLKYEIGAVLNKSNEDKLINVVNNWHEYPTFYKQKKEKCYKARSI